MDQLVSSGSATLEPKTFTSSRLKVSLLLIVSLAFVVISIPEGIGFGAIFFVICAILLAWLLFHPFVLTLDPVGFELTGGLGRASKKTAWADVEGFSVYRLPRGTKIIALNYRPGAAPQMGANYLPGAALKAASASNMLRFGGSPSLWAGSLPQGSLPGAWPLGVKAMVDELNAYRERALTQHVN